MWRCARFSGCSGCSWCADVEDFEDVQAAVPDAWAALRTPNPSQTNSCYLRPNFRLNLALPAWITNGDFELKGCMVHFLSLNSIIPWCVLFNAQTACDMTEPEVLQSIMPSLPTSAAVVSRKWHSAGRALGCANDPWLMGHRQSSDPTVRAVPQLPQDVSESMQAWHCNTP